MTDNNLCFTIWIQKLLLRRNTDTKTLYYNIKNDNKKIGTLELCEQLGIETIPIRSSDLNKTLLCITRGSIPGMPDTLPVNIPIMYDLPELLVFSGFEEADVRSFLTEYKQKGIEKIPLKCMITPYNLSWSLFDLVEHLKEENRNER